MPNQGKRKDRRKKSKNLKVGLSRIGSDWAGEHSKVRKGWDCLGFVGFPNTTGSRAGWAGCSTVFDGVHYRDKATWRRRRAWNRVLACRLGWFSRSEQRERRDGDEPDGQAEGT